MVSPVDLTPAKPIVVGPIGQCIYGADHASDGLSTEHVIPFGLGGGVILTGASCEGCRKITHKFETVCLEKHWKALRTLERLPTRRPKKRPSHFPISAKTSSGEMQHQIPIEKYPVAFTLPEFMTTPGMARKEDKYRLLKRDLVFMRVDKNGGYKRTMRELKAREIKFSSSVDHGAFARLLAKIAHGLAIAGYGVDNLQPFLLDIILDANFENLGLLLGRSNPLPTIPSHRSHHFEYGCWETTHGKYVVGVKIRLFAHIEGTPSYLVMAGFVDDPRREPKGWPAR